MKKKEERIIKMARVESEIKENTKKNFFLFFKAKRNANENDRIREKEIIVER